MLTAAMSRWQEQGPGPGQGLQVGQGHCHSEQQCVSVLRAAFLLNAQARPAPGPSQETRG